MRFPFFSDTAKGVTLGLLTFMLTFSSIPIPVATAATQPLFAMTLEAPTNNPTRRQIASIIQNSFSSAGISTNLIFVSFTQLLAFLLGCSNGCPAKSFSQGGWDAGFVGNGGGTVLPDFGTQNVMFYKNEGANDIPPVGSNYYFWKNTTFNQLADQYGSTFDKTVALGIAQKMVQIAAQERPGIITYYPVNVYAYSPSFKPWGTANAVTSTTVGLDWAHWKTAADAAINVGSTGPLDAVNPLPTAAQNSFYDRLIWGSIQAGTGTEEADSRGAGVYFNALATSITSSSDHLTWTETVKPHNFQDGVAVTADDYIFTVMSQLRLDVGWVGLGTITSQLGINDQFNFRNGTSRYVVNGTYFSTKPSGFTPTSVWTAVDKNTFTFTMPVAYVFADPLVTLVSPLPMHIYEKVPAKTWSSSFLSGFNAQGALTNTPTTVTWSTATYGGNGSYAHVFGPVGDGAYMYRGYDSVSQSGTLVRFDGYWNASGLQALGQFTDPAPDGGPGTVNIGGSDVDMYQAVAPDNGTIVIDTKTDRYGSGGANTYVRVFDTQGNEIASGSASSVIGVITFQRIAPPYDTREETTTARTTATSSPTLAFGPRRAARRQHQSGSLVRPASASPRHEPDDRQGVGRVLCLVQRCSHHPRGRRFCPCRERSARRRQMPADFLRP